MGGGQSDNGQTERELVPAGTILEGKYRIERLIGAGGMGAVYAGVHVKLDKRVAIKILQPALAGKRDMVGRMIREARAASATGHPNIVAVTDLGEHDGAPFIIMEYLDGEPLSKKIRRSPLPWSAAVSIICQVLDALCQVHKCGIIHRDLKPENLMVVPGPEQRPMVKVLDFGISKVSKDAPGTDIHTQTGAVLGTPAFMSPEQALGTELDVRTDIHSLGSVLYALLVGTPPFVGPNTTATLARILDGAFIPVSELVSGVPAQIDVVIRRALANDREQRYPDAAAMRDALRSLQEGDAAPPQAPANEDFSIALEPDPEPVPAGGAVPASYSAALAEPEVEPLKLETETSAPRAHRQRPQSRLEVSVPQGWKPGGERRDDVRSPIGRRGAVPRGWYALVVVVVAGAVAVWHFADELDAGLGAAADATEELGGAGAVGEADTVLIMVRTRVKNPSVFLDGVRQDSTTLSVPRSDGPIDVRVEARGYEAKTKIVRPSETQVVEFTLVRKRGRR